MKKVTFGSKPNSAIPFRSPDEWVQERAAAEPSRRLTFDIPLSLHRRIKRACVEQDRQMADLLRELLDQHFGSTS